MELHGPRRRRLGRLRAGAERIVVSGRKAYLDRVVYRIVKDSTVAYQMLLQGEFDIYTILLPDMWQQQMPETAFLRTNYNRSKFYDPNYSWIGWNTRRPFFADARVVWR